MNLSFKKITALILCISFISGVVSLVFSNTNPQNKVAEYTQTADESEKSENKLSEEMPDGKIDYLANQYSISFNLIQGKYELESSNDASFFLLYPPFSPPKA